MQLDSGEIFALKPSNVDLLPGGNQDEDGHGAGVPGLQKIEEMLMQMGLSRPQLAEAKRQLAGLQKMLTDATGLDPKQALLGVGAVVLLTIYFLVSVKYILQLYVVFLLLILVSRPSWSWCPVPFGLGLGLQPGPLGLGVLFATFLRKLCHLFQTLRDLFGLLF